MTNITKEELHKLIDEADIENLQKTYAEYSEKSSGMLIGNRLGAIVRYLKESQKPKELTLHEKLINAGGILKKGTFCNNYAFPNKIEVAVREENVYIFDSINSRKNCLMFIDENNHAKVFEAIEFLTKWQA